MGCLPLVHVVSEVIMPLTVLEVCAFPKGMILTKASPPTIMAINNIAKVSFPKMKFP
jgi:hypothetical protein